MPEVGRLEVAVLEPGRAAAVDALVSAADTARGLGSGDVEVLGTPRVLALVEAATVAAVADALPAGQTTVGVRVELEHLAPSPVGSAVRAEARLVEVGGRRLRFEVSLSQDGQTVARGQVLRAVVDRARFPG